MGDYITERGEAKRPKVLGKLATITPEQAADYLRAYPEAYRRDLAAKLAEFRGWVESPDSTGRLGIYADSETLNIFANWRGDQVTAEEMAAKEAYLASTYEVQEWKGSKFAKPTRVPKSDAAWSKPGHVLIERGVDVRVPEDDGRDSLSFAANYTIRTTSIGAEWPEGTVKAKRLIRTEQGRRVQYLVKPRGAAAERRYRDAKRLQEIETSLRVDADYLRDEQRKALHAEADAIRARLAPAARV